MPGRDLVRLWGIPPCRVDLSVSNTPRRPTSWTAHAWRVNPVRAISRASLFLPDVEVGGAGFWDRSKSVYPPWYENRFDLNPVAFPSHGTPLTRSEPTSVALQTERGRRSPARFIFSAIAETIDFIVHLLAYRHITTVVHTFAVAAGDGSG